MADKTIGELPSVSSVQDASLIPMEQGGIAYKMTGAQIRAFAQAAAQIYVSQAQTAAEQAQTAATGATNAQTAATAADASADSAEASRQAIENMTVEGVTLPAGSNVTVTKTVELVGAQGVVKLTFSIPQGAKGDTGNTGADGVSPTITITPISAGTRITITDADHPNGQSFDVLNGTGSGDMRAAVYDPDDDVATAGGIVDYVAGIIAGLSIPAPSSATPAMNGTASAGSGTAYARGDHVHPTDTTRQEKITASGLLKGNGNGGVSAATVGADYQAPLVQGSNITLNGNTISAAGLSTYRGTLLASGWTASGGYYTQTITVSGLKASYTVAPMIDVDLSQTARNDAAADAAIIEAWGLIGIVNTGANSLTAYCTGNAPTVAVPVMVNVWE